MVPVIIHPDFYTATTICQDETQDKEHRQRRKEEATSTTQNECQVIVIASSITTQKGHHQGNQEYQKRECTALAGIEHQRCQTKY